MGFFTVSLSGMDRTKESKDVPINIEKAHKKIPGQTVKPVEGKSVEELKETNL
jgi:hypothetical protein